MTPLWPAINSGVGARLLWACRYDEAIEQLQESLEMDPNLCLAHMYLGWAYQPKGNPEKAIDELRKAILFDAGPVELASLPHAYAPAVMRVGRKVFSRTWRSDRGALTLRRTI